MSKADIKHVTKTLRKAPPIMHARHPSAQQLPNGPQERHSTHGVKKGRCSRSSDAFNKDGRNYPRSFRVPSIGTSSKFRKYLFQLYARIKVRPIALVRRRSYTL